MRRNETLNDPSTEDKDVLIHAEVYILGGFCEIEEPKELALAKYKIEARECYMSPAFVASLGSIYRGLPATKSCSSSNAILNIVSSRLSSLNMRPYFKALLADIPEFALRLAERHLVRTSEYLYRLNCTTCDKEYAICPKCQTRKEFMSRSMIDWRIILGIST